ncbi:hypothetical protein COCON_G00221580 [Conger conger]|uniref:Uncharacterized protein n=1 Tax=Conger conger TaxID=82655 RepID=A0A9Q1CVX4_CONCO|nr:hypothetical protein COCON_G00221580 [Conger conger]
MFVYHQDVDITSECLPPTGFQKKVTLDESNRTWGRSTIYKPEEFEDVRKGFKKKVRTWGPSSVQTKDRPTGAERVRPLSDGSNPWSTSLMKTQKSVPLAALFVEQGMNPEEPCAGEGLDGNKPKQLKFPSQVYIDLPLWKDESGEGGAAVESQEEPATSASSASTTPQVTPTNSLKRAGRRRTDAALYGCASLLALVALGGDLREAGGEEPEPREERRRREGLFQRATRFRRSSSPPAGRARRDDAPPALTAPSASTRCLLLPDAEGPETGPLKEGPPSNWPAPKAPAKPDPLPPPPASDHSSSTWLRRRKTTPSSTHISNGTNAHAAPTLPPAPAPEAAVPERKRPEADSAPDRPRPLSLRGKPHSWGLLRGRNKSYSLGHYSGEKSARSLNILLSAEAGAGCSLLDVDSEGQKRDCTVPLCRIQSSPGRPSLYELS